MPSWLLQALIAGLGTLLLTVGGWAIYVHATLRVIETNQEFLIRWVHDTDKQRAGELADAAEAIAQLRRLQEDVAWLVADKQRQLQNYRERERASQAPPPSLPSSHPLLLQGP